MLFSIGAQCTAMVAKAFWHAQPAEFSSHPKSEDNMKPDASARTVPAIVQAVRILRYLARCGRALGVTKIARETGISPSSCFNLLRTMAGQRLVDFDSKNKTYSLGIGLIEISAGLLGLGHIILIRPELDVLAQNYGALLALWHITGDDRLVLIDRIYPNTPVRIELQLAQRLPAYAGAVGRCVAAAIEISEDQLRKHFSKLRWQVPLTFDAYLASIARARSEGFALDEGHLFRGVHSVATVLRANGRPQLGISGVTIAGQLSNKDLRRLGSELNDVATLISRIPYKRGKRQVG